MAEPRVPSKSELLEALRASGETALERLRALPAEQFETGRYEGGWNGRQILAHFASIEWTYPRLLDLAKPGPSPAAPEKPQEVRRTWPRRRCRTPPGTHQRLSRSYLAARRGWIWKDPFQNLRDRRSKIAAHQVELRGKHLDELLAKIHREGLGSLSQREKDFLKRMSGRDRS